MKFEGSLDAFSLPDIFQLLSFTKKSGGLRLRHAQAEGVVWFVEGFVTGATSDVAHQALARRIAGIGLASPEAYRAAVEASAGTGGAVGVARALLEAGAVDSQLLQATVAAQATDAVSELLRWPTGDFALVEGANPDDIGVVLPSDGLVNEAIARTAAWERLAEVLPSPDVVLALRPLALEGDVVLTPEEWSLLALVDSRRTVGAIVALTGRGQFSVVSTLAELVRRGLLHPRGAQDPIAELEELLALLGPLESAPATELRAPVVEIQPSPVEDLATVVESFVEAPPEPTAEPVAPPSIFGAPGRSPIPAAARAVEVADDAAAEDLGLEDLDDLADAPPSLTLALTRINAEAAADDDDGDDDDDDVEDAPLPRVGGAHVPGDVVPPRAEPFLPSRQPEHPESAPPAVARLAGLSSVGAVHGSAAVAADPQTSSLIERDPSVNRSLLLRLIAGVRGL